ncbi:zinc finger MYM-type protein 1-like [Zingiber officinale]|uniref:zinc finger MYM-type protein 1-like n=1 Tax=Zingiber officinale TaxID=94328 RepID=UPI001C4B8A8E|nr:zinc finger MYM-type protein 1-like [Zingiber officinale]
MKNQKNFDFFRKKNDESTSDLNGPNNIFPCISEPASTKRPRLENETLNEPLSNSSNNLQYVSDPGIRIPILQHPIELQDEGHDESIASKNRGNYLELVALLGRMNPEIGSTLEKASKNAKYTSPEIQREILKIIADIVRDKIRAEIGEAKFCILVDEAIDESSKEQMAIILRYVDRDGFIRERFFEVVHVENTSALTLKKEICNVFNQYNLLTENLRGQGYDGASNMRGEWNGLQTLFLKDSPHAYYIHCFAHRLQLALVAVSKEVHDVWHFFSTLTSAINFVGSSAKRQFQLKSIQKAEINDLIKLGEIDIGIGSNQDCSLVRAGATRWSSHFNSVRRFISLFGSVSTLFQDLVDKGPNSNIRGEAKGLYLDIKSFDFVFVLFLMHEVLGISDKLCQTLQKNDIDILNAINLVYTTRLNLQQIRDDRWEGFLWSVLKFCESNDVEVPDFDDCYTRGTKRSCQQKNNITIHDHYHFEIFNAVIDFQLMELNERFPEGTIELLTLSNALSLVDGFKSFSLSDICSLVDKFYYYDFNLEERGDLERELDHYKFDIPRHAQFQNLNSLHHLCQTLARTTKSVIYPLIDRLVRLVLTLPVVRTKSS